MLFLQSIFHIILTLLFSLEQLRTENHNITIETHFNETEELTDDEEITRRVINGVKASLGEVPFIVSFKAGKWSRGEFTGEAYCGGTLVKPDKILTAAHCFTESKECCRFVRHTPFNLNKIFAVMGQLTNRATYSPKKKNDGQWRTLKNLTYHPNYYFPRDDIAIVFTTKPFDINQQVATINFAREHKEYTGHCTVAGFGTTEKKILSPDLLLGTVQLISTNDCQRRGRLSHIRHRYKVICSSKTKADVDKGDSGGPLFCRSTGDPGESSYGILVGIMSGVTLTLGSSDFSFYTRTSSFTTYIDRNEATQMMKYSFHSIEMRVGIFLIIRLCLP